jgi:hypothetical protein
MYLTQEQVPIEDSGVLELLAAPYHGDTPVQIDSFMYADRDDTLREYVLDISSDGGRSPLLSYSPAPTTPLVFLQLGNKEQY